MSSKTKKQKQIAGCGPPDPPTQLINAGSATVVFHTPTARLSSESHCWALMTVTFSLGSGQVCFLLSQGSGY